VHSLNYEIIDLKFPYFGGRIRKNCNWRCNFLVKCSCWVIR